MTEKLVCDRCDIEYTDKDSIEMAKHYQELWAKLCRQNGVEPRGLSSCPNIGCPGELQLKEV